MPTYQEAITRVSQKVRDSGAWPDNSSKLTEQLYLLYNAALVVMKDIPLNRLTAATSASIEHEDAGANMVRYPLPADTFGFRPDLGIKRLIFDSVDRFPHQSLPYDSLFARAGIGMLMHAGQILFSISAAENIVYSTYLGDFKLVYVQEPTKPGTASVDFPLPDGNDFEVACSVVAAHVSGETVRDPQQPTFQAFLTQVYGDQSEQQSA